MAVVVVSGAGVRRLNRLEGGECSWLDRLAALELCLVHGELDLIGSGSRAQLLLFFVLFQSQRDKLFVIKIENKLRKHIYIE